MGIIYTLHFSPNTKVKKEKPHLKGPYLVKNTNFLCTFLQAKAYPLRGEGGPRSIYCYFIWLAAILKKKFQEVGFLRTLNISK